MGAAQSGEGCVLDADVVAYPPPWRVAAAILKVVARGSLLLTLAALLFSDDPPTNPLRQMRLFGGLFAAPEAAAWCIARAFAARARVEGGSLVLARPDRRVEIPLEAITGIEPWRLPLPCGGLWLRLRSGRRFALALAVADAVGFVEGMVIAGASPSIRDGLSSPLVVFAQARQASPRRVLDHPIVKFVVFPLVPTLPVFRLHQIIAYGAAFGEYYTYGLKAYLLGFGLWWVSWSLNLVFVAAGARAVVEVVALVAAVAIPTYAAGTRRGLEAAQRLFYYVGIPAWLALRLLA